MIGTSVYPAIQSKNTALLLSLLLTSKPAASPSALPPFQPATLAPAAPIPGKTPQSSAWIVTVDTNHVTPLLHIPSGGSSTFLEC